MRAIALFLAALFGLTILSATPASAHTEFPHATLFGVPHATDGILDGHSNVTDVDETHVGIHLDADGEVLVTRDQGLSDGFRAKIRVYCHRDSTEAVVNLLLHNFRVQHGHQIDEDDAPGLERAAFPDVTKQVPAGGCNVIRAAYSATFWGDSSGGNILEGGVNYGWSGYARLAGSPAV